MPRLGIRVAAVGACAALALNTAVAHAASTTPVTFSFSGTTSGQQVTSVANEGSGGTDQAVVSAGQGALVARWSRIGTGMAVRFPAYDGAADGPRAVIAVTNRGSGDDLDPGAAEFWFGADAKLDATNVGTAYDNGNNLVQRGLAGDPAQYKIQVDAGKFSCRVKGRDGVIMLTSSLTIASSTWYHVRCKRRVGDKGDYLVLTVAKVKADGSYGPARTDVSNVRALGPLSFAKATPFSIGGKLSDATTIAPESDQWNGVIDSVFLTVRS